jgi:hypothetical protein
VISPAKLAVANQRVMSIFKVLFMQVA